MATIEDEFRCTGMDGSLHVADGGGEECFREGFNLSLSIDIDDIEPSDIKEV